MQEEIKVCLDAGHYGKYNRSPVLPEYYESDMNWKLHLLLKEELEGFGIEVVTTRAEQAQDLGLESRGRMAAGCKLFLSLHANASQIENADYALGVHMVDDNCGVMDEQSAELAQILSGTVAQVMGTAARIWTRESSCDRDGNGYKDDYFGVLRGAHSVGVPGVILEHGFYTNPAQAAWLMEEQNLQKLAAAEAEAIAAWLGIAKKVPTVSVTLPVIYPGDKGAFVEVMQALLIGYGYRCGKEGVDGSNGPATQKALKSYQRDCELEADGKCGPATWGSLTRQG